MEKHPYEVRAKKNPPFGLGMVWNGMVKDTNPMDIYKQFKKGNLCDNFSVPWLFIDHQLSYINLQPSTSQNWEHHTYLTWVDNKASSHVGEFFLSLQR